MVISLQTLRWRCYRMLWLLICFTCTQIQTMNSLSWWRCVFVSRRVCASRNFNSAGLQGYLELQSDSISRKTHTRITQIHLQRPEEAEVFIRWWNVLLVFISGFGTQSGLLVAVMEQIAQRAVERDWPTSWRERFISLQKSKGGMRERIRIRKGGRGRWR